MSMDRFWSVVGQVGFMCAVGAIMTMMSIAAISAASVGVGPLCGTESCMTIAAK